MITIRPLTHEDIDQVVRDARQADIDEMMDGAGATVGECLELGLDQSMRSWAICSGQVVIAAVGDTMHSIGVGIPWMVTTEHVPANARGFLRASKMILAEMQTRHATLFNVVDDRNKAAIRWLEWLGFSMSEPAPAGIMGLPFRKFTLYRSD